MMDTEKIYQDSDGNECTIHQVVRLEPDWAACRVQEGEKAIAKVEQLTKAHGNLNRVIATLIAAGAVTSEQVNTAVDFINDQGNEE